ncbi:MAG: DUF4332 domain-containing protein [Candidatus Cloacimonetes bacterium]|nr:DUF4332 domain-containing protein [Candidatus Cloacimonadota bacterium]
MNEFALFLKKKGKKPNVVNDLVSRMNEFAGYIQEASHLDLSSVNSVHIDDFTESLLHRKESPNNYLRAIALFYKFSGKTELALHASSLRENLISPTRNKFKLKDFNDSDPLHIEAFRKAGIIYTEDILPEAVTPQDREYLAQKTGLPYNIILEYAKLADLTRIGSIKKVRARLYYLAGFDTIEKIAAMEPDTFRQAVSDFITKNNYNAIPPTPKESENTIATARKLKSMIRDH